MDLVCQSVLTRYFLCLGRKFIVIYIVVTLGVKYVSELKSCDLDFPESQYMLVILSDCVFVCIYFNKFSLFFFPTLIWQAASIFKGPVPPIVPFSLGSLGFMTPFRILFIFDVISLL